MTPIRARLPRSSRLSWGRTSGTAATSSACAVAASAMGGALGVDPDAVLGQAERDDVILGDPLWNGAPIDRHVAGRHQCLVYAGSEVGRWEAVDLYVLRSSG